MVSYTHFIAFGLLMLSGLNLPISEDIVFLVSGSIAATIVPENVVLIFLGCYLGAFLSDSIAYCIGRFAGRRLLEIQLVRRLFHADRILTVERYFVSYGGKTLFFGRFIPFGVRNVLFMTSGFVRMRYIKFFFIDLAAVTITSMILFSLGHTLGSGYTKVFPYLQRYRITIIIILALVISGIFLIRKIQGSRNASLV